MSWDLSLQTWSRRRRLVVDLFVLANIAFLALDIYIAHSVNNFAHPLEWVPFVFSVAATPILGLAIVAEWKFGRGAGRRLGLLTGWVAIAVGIGGMILHLKSQFFAAQTIHSLVYTAPFAAPLAYAGLGFLILMNRMVDANDTAWGRWVVLFGLGGFVGNFILSLCDHAQNGFFLLTEWIPVVSSAYAVSFFALAVFMPLNGSFLGVCLYLALAQAVVGALGFLLHLHGISGGVSSLLRENILFGPPVFAPLLFANLAVLVGIGLYDLKTRAYTNLRRRNSLVQ
ncbi:MAG: hypothetical protein IH987_01400 [Planctomycetes bacterium]|nr:hypothetical protein [Planctomycetota bacterium]